MFQTSILDQKKSSKNVKIITFLKLFLNAMIRNIKIKIQYLYH